MSATTACGYCDKPTPELGELGWCEACEADLAKAADVTHEAAVTFLCAAIAAARHEGLDDEQILGIVVDELRGDHPTRLTGAWC